MQRWLGCGDASSIASRLVSLHMRKAARKFTAKTQRKAELRVTGSTSQAISGLPAHLHIFLALFRKIV